MREEKLKAVICPAIVEGATSGAIEGVDEVIFERLIKKNKIVVNERVFLLCSGNREYHVIIAVADEEVAYRIEGVLHDLNPKRLDSKSRVVKLGKIGFVVGEKADKIASVFRDAGLDIIHYTERAGYF